MDTGATPNEKRWVVGVDGSPDAEAALMWATGLATDRGERVTPVGAWHLPAVLATLAGRRGGDVDRIGLQAGAAVAADQAVAALGNTDNVDPPEILEGRAASVLLEQSSDDTVVVVGRRGVTGLRHRLLGSVSQYVVTHATGPVVVVPADWSDRPCQRIVVGFDGSDHSVEALRWALDIATDDTDVVALIAIEVAPGLSPELKRERLWRAPSSRPWQRPTGPIRAGERDDRSSCRTLGWPSSTCSGAPTSSSSDPAASVVSPGHSLARSRHGS